MVIFDTPDLSISQRPEAGRLLVVDTRQLDADELYAQLSVREASQAARFRAVPRRSAYIFGRYLARRLVAEWLELSEDTSTPWAASEQDLSGIEILAADSSRSTSSPVVYFDGEQLPVSISLSHLDGWVAAGLASNQVAGIGVDLVRVQPPARGFLRLWFTESERSAIDASAQPDVDIARIWSAKEATYKCLGRGQSFRPQDWEVSLADDAAIVTSNGVSVRSRWYEISGDTLLCVVTQPQDYTPI